MSEFESDINTLIQGFIEISKYNTEGKKVFFDAIKLCNSIDEIKKLMSKFTITVFEEMSYLSLATAVNLKINTELNKTVEKILDELPEDFHKIKTELKSHVSEYLQPISKKFKEGQDNEDFINKLAKEREGWAKNLYG